MPSLDDHFHALTKIRPPEDWPQLGEDVHRPSPRQPTLRRRVGVASLALLVAAGGFFVALRAFRGSAPATSSSGPANKTSQPAPTSSSATPPSRALRGVFAAMLDAIRTSSPPGWRFALEGDRVDGDWRLDGNVDDGLGPGRLYVDVTIRPGMLLAHPCADSEFRRGARCVEQLLPDGDLLVLRGVVIDHGGMKTIEAVLVHPDRSGIGAEAGNWTIAPLGNGPVSQSDLPSPRVTRTDPLYTVERLGRLVQAVDEKARACIRTRCQ
jgi:hypothetical protein